MEKNSFSDFLKDFGKFIRRRGYKDFTIEELALFMLKRGWKLGRFLAFFKHMVKTNIVEKREDKYVVKKFTFQFHLRAVGVKKLQVVKAK